MAEEVFSEDWSKKFIDIHNPIKIGIEYFFSRLIFDGDVSKIVYATPDIAFRRRIELLDTGRAEGSIVGPETLSLPFASYCQTSDFEEDDRGATQQASQAIVGEYSTVLNQRIRSIAVKSTYETTIYCSRRDMARYFSQLLFWEQSPKAPIYFGVDVSYKGRLISVPVFITIDKIDSNVLYKESDALDKARIFPLKVTMTVRSYELLIPSVKAVESLPIRWGKNYSPETYSDDETIYIADETVLLWASGKFDLSTDEKADTGSAELKTIAKKYFESESVAESDIAKLGMVLTNNESANIIRGYFTETTESTLASYSINTSLTTSSSLTIAYRIKPADKKYLDHLTFYIPGHPSVTVTDCNLTSLTVTGLSANSTYNMKIVSTSLNGDTITYQLAGTTADSSGNLAPSAGHINKRGNIFIGRVF